MNEIIAIRRNIGANGVFYRQIGLDVEYSLDKVTWFHAFRLNAQTKTTKGSIDLLGDLDRLIDQYSRKYYLDLDFKALINLDVTVTTRTGAINTPPERAYNPLRMCIALRVFLRTMRDVGLGISNGNIETDDIRRFGAEARRIGTDVSIALLGDGLAGQVIGGAFQLSFYIWEGLSFSFAQLVGNWTNQEIDDYVCCLYEALESGEFNYSEFVTAGETCMIGAWDEIATPQNYAGLVNMVAYGELPTDKCPCEECLVYIPTDGDIQLGVVSGETLITQDYVVSGSLRRMGNRVEFTIPNMVITSVKVLIGLQAYENTADPAVPRMQFIAPSTGGGFTDLTNGLNWYEIDSAQYPLVPVNNFTLLTNSSTCSACSTAQLATYNESFASLIFVVVCGILQ